MKCVSCGIGFFSPDGSDKCSKCRPSESHDSPGDEHSSHGDEHSCGCGHSH